LVHVIFKMFINRTYTGVVESVGPWHTATQPQDEY